MNSGNKRKNMQQDDSKPKRVKKECDYGERCYRRNPAHFREFSHKHLEAILDTYSGTGSYNIPDKYDMERVSITEQLDVIVEKQLYTPWHKTDSTLKAAGDKAAKVNNNNDGASSSITDTPARPQEKTFQNSPNTHSIQTTSTSAQDNQRKPLKDSDYRPIVPPTRRVEDFLNVCVPKGNMSAKHAASAPYYIFYTTITAARDTHNQPYSITFQEILDRSLGELKCSLQINFMVELGWLLAQYYFAGYSEKKLTILYGEDSPDLQTISQKKPHVDAHMVRMSTPFGKHHTKMMLLCYEDGSMRVVVSTANLYLDDWENRVQGLWFSPRCPELPPTAMPHEGDSPTLFKRTLLRYLNHYQLPALTRYMERVKRCDFSHINVFLVASVPGSHFDTEWGMTRVGSLLRQHCAVPATETKQWTMLAQASSIGSYGKDPSSWLTGDFLHHFTKIKDQPQTLSSPAALKIIYPSLENVQRSHDGLLGGGCLPYAASAHTKQTWLNDFLHQWIADRAKRTRAMPHIKSYTRISPDNKRAAYFLLTSGNISKLICFWCFLLGAAVRAQNDYYAPQTFRQQLEGFQRGLFSPAGGDGQPQSTSQSWSPIDSKEPWRATPRLTNVVPEAGPAFKQEPWRLPYGISKEQQAAILHHKQALTSEGAFRFEYASDNGLAAGEQIEPDGSRVGAYQYKDPSGQLVKLKYRAGKDGFQILEGSHLPKSPEPVAPQTPDNHYQQAYAQQRQQYELQQQYNQQRPETSPQQAWRDDQGQEGQRGAGGQYFSQSTSWRPQGGQEDDGQYRENEVENKGPHSFGEGYAFAFKG